MDFYINLGISVLLQVISDRKQAKRFYPALAKIFVKLELAAVLDQSFAVEIEHQRKKQGVIS